MDCTQIAMPPASGMLALCPAAEPGRFTASLPSGAAGQWCRMSATLDRPGAWWIRVSALDEARGQVVRAAFLGPLRGHTRTLLLHVPRDASRLTLAVFAEGETGGVAPAVCLRVLRRVAAAVRLVAFGWRRLPACLRGDGSGLAGRVRSELGQAPARAGEAPPYEVWRRLYQSWDDADRGALMLAIGRCAPVEVVVLPAQDRLAPAQALESASLASVATQWSRPARVIRAGQDDTWQRAPGTWLLILHAGERLAPFATACFALAIGRCSAETRLVYADTDDVQDGLTNPLFKPSADPWLKESGLLTRGCCAVHPDVAVAASVMADHDPRAKLAASIPAAAMQRIPFILTHVPAGVSGSPRKPPACVANDTPFVTIIVPSACRSRHVLRCLSGLVATTDYANLEILIVVSHVDPADRRQLALLKALCRLPAVRVIDAACPVFNYAAVNNLAASQARGDLLLLLNDDVLPIRPDWLRRLVSFTTGGAVQADIVGARLLYGNDRVQHGGVIVGLANLCENAFRLSVRSDAGPHGIALLDRQVSAVTGACMLVRRSVWQDRRGFDESFCIALNDVDFCLRAGQAGARIVYAAGVELYHFESLSLGRHYHGERAALEVREVRRLRDRWQSAIANDPFYNPQASLEPGREFQPAFPPRLTPLRWVAGDDADLC